MDWIAFGDDSNDIDMLAGCGTGIAMCGSKPEVIAAADGVTMHTNDEDGVAHFMDRLLQCCNYVLHQ